MAERGEESGAFCNTDGHLFLVHRNIAHLVAVMRSVHTQEAQLTDSHVV